MAIETKEITFEQEIEYSLLDHGGYIKGNPRDYNREFAIDTKQLFQFLQDSQPVEWEKLCRKHGENVETGFLKKLYRDLDTYGTLYVLRHGVVDAPAKLSLCYFKPASCAVHQWIACCDGGTEKSNHRSDCRKCKASVHERP